MCEWGCVRGAKSSGAIYSYAGLFRMCFKAHGVHFSSDPTGPVGMMYARTGMPTMNTLNQHGACFRLDLWEPYGLLLVRLRVQMNGIPFHTRRRTLIFRSSHFPPLLPSFFFRKSLLQTPLLLLFISAAPSETLIPLWVGRSLGSYCSDKCTTDCVRILTRLCGESWVDTWA